MTEPTEREILHALFRLSRDTRRISARSLAAEAQITPTRAASALLALERRGLVDASRARLTMLGLSHAVATGAAQGGGGVPVSRSLQPPGPNAPPERRPPLAAAALLEAPARPVS